MLFLLINYGTPILFGIGIVICYIAKSQNQHLLYEYGFWSFVVFLVSRLISIIQPILIFSGMGQEMAGGGMPFWITGLNLFREFLGIVGYLILIVGFYKSLKSEKSKQVQK